MLFHSDGNDSTKRGEDEIRCSDEGSSLMPISSASNSAPIDVGESHGNLCDADATSGDNGLVDTRQHGRSQQQRTNEVDVDAIPSDTITAVGGGRESDLDSIEKSSGQ